MDDEENDGKKQEVDSQIYFKNRGKYFKIKNILRTLSFVLIAAVSGSISARIVVKNTFSEENVSNNITDKYNLNKDSLQKNFSDAIERVSYSLVSISDEIDKLSQNTYVDGNITGIVVKKEGYIITSYSKIKEFDNIYVNVTEAGIKPYTGSLVSYNEETDVALIKIDYDKLTPIEIEKDNNYKEGEFIISIGNAVSDSYVGISLPGIITSTNEELKDNEGNIYPIIQTNTVINNFNNGGLICNMEGKLIAINSEFINNKFGGDILSFSISGKEISDIIEKLINQTDILGINRGVALSDNKDNIKGVYVATVKSGSIADKAGITPTDIIIDINGVEVYTPEDIYELIKKENIGDTIEGHILRDGIKTRIKLVIE